MGLKKLLSVFLVCGLMITSLAIPSADVKAADASSAFSSINLATSYKELTQNNPCTTLHFSADPGVMEYDGRVYVYATNDGDATVNHATENTYGQINTLTCMSSSDMVNWTDHGIINDVYNFGTSDGTNVCQWTYGGYKNQQWVFEKTSYTSQTETTPSPSPSASTEPSTPTQSTGLPTGISCEYKVVSDWGSSFQGQIILTNNSSNTYNGWNLSFDYNSTINSLWGAELASQSGTKVVVKNASWDTTLAPGASVTIQYTASGTDKSEPVNYSFY